MPLVLGAVGWLLTSCATLQVPASPPSLPQQQMLRSSGQGIDIGVMPIAAEDDYLRLFDENLPRSGIAALWVEVHNTRTTAIEVRTVNWYLRMGDRMFRAASISDVFKRFYEGNRIRMYSIRSDDAARRDMEGVAFHSGRIQSSQKREGFLFFRIDPEMASIWDRGATLCARDLRLDRRSKTSLEVALSHAHP